MQIECRRWKNWHRLYFVICCGFSLKLWNFIGLDFITFHRGCFDKWYEAFDIGCCWFYLFRVCTLSHNLNNYSSGKISNMSVIIWHKIGWLGYIWEREKNEHAEPLTPIVIAINTICYTILYIFFALLNGFLLFSRLITVRPRFARVQCKMGAWFHFYNHIISLGAVWAWPSDSFNLFMCQFTASEYFCLCVHWCANH